MSKTVCKFSCFKCEMPLMKINVLHFKFMGIKAICIL